MELQLKSPIFFLSEENLTNFKNSLFKFLK